MQRRRRRRSDSFVQTFAGEYKLMKLDEVYGRKLGEGSSEKSVTRTSTKGEPADRQRSKGRFCHLDAALLLGTSRNKKLLVTSNQGQRY